MTAGTATGLSTVITMAVLGAESEIRELAPLMFQIMRFSNIYWIDRFSGSGIKYS